jgi:hypothetical protein
MALNVMKSVKKHYMKILLLVIVLVILYYVYGNFVENYDGKAHRVCVNIENTTTGSDIYVSIYKVDKLEEDDGSIRYKSKRILKDYRLKPSSSSGYNFKTFNFTTGNFGYIVEVEHVATSSTAISYNVKHRYQEKYTVKNFWGMKRTKYRCSGTMRNMSNIDTITTTGSPAGTATAALVDDYDNTATLQALLKSTTAGSPYARMYQNP